MCQLTDIIFFTMRGISTDLADVIDLEYIIDAKELREYGEDGIIWRGLSKSVLKYNKNESKWEVSTLSSGKPILTLETKVNTELLNYKQWQ